MVCAWCEKDGKPESEALIGEREPLTDKRASHGICPHHRHEIEERVKRLKEEAERQRIAAEAQRAEAETLQQKVDP